MKLSPEEIIEVEKLSPAFQLYQQWLRRAPPENIDDHLRWQRHQLWSSACAATLLNKESAENICKEWSKNADELITRAFNMANVDNEPLAVFALGKLGARELNLSSDIDLILVRDDNIPINKMFIRRFLQILGENTTMGFCFRVDLDLRPGGRHGPYLPTQSEFEDYYGNYCETWERLALVRLRPICGAPSIQESIIKFTHQLIYRKHLDYTLLEELQLLRQKIHDHYWFAQNQADEVNVKLVCGGIRDIELFVNSLQVIHGGRQQALRITSTDAALKKIQEFNFLPKDECKFLLETYWRLRTFENLSQAVEDQQTHIFQKQQWPQTWIQQWSKNLISDLAKVDYIVCELIGSVDSGTNDLPEEYSDQVKWIKNLGYKEELVEQHWQEIWQSTSLSIKKARSEIARRQFLGQYLKAAKEIDLDLDMALIRLKDFIRVARTKATFFTLLNRQPELLKDLAWLFSASPYLGQVICARPELIDSFFMRIQAPYEKDFDLLLEQLAEKRLLTEILAGTQFLKNLNLEALTSAMSQTADQICLVLLARLKEQWPDSNLSILALGKWGGRELGLNSDLDFIYIGSEVTNPNEAKIARRFTARLTEPHKGGCIYNIDLRLRPSGQAGLLIVSEENLLNYLSNEAAAWERQAYLRARCLNKDMRDKIMSACSEKGLSDTELEELKDIRIRLLEKQKSSYDIKFCAGGLIDVEFTVQIALLREGLVAGPDTLSMLKKLAESNSTWQTQFENLLINYQFLRTLIQLQSFISHEPSTEIMTNKPIFDKLVKLWRSDATSLKNRLSDTLAQNIMILNQLDPCKTPR